MGDIKNKLIPNKWIWVKISDIYNIVGGGTPSTNNPEFWNGDIPWITSADIYGLHDIRPRKVISKNGIANSATSLVPGGSIIVVTRVGLGKLALTKNPICFSQDSQALLGKNELINPKYSLYFLSNAVEIFKYQNRGTTIPGVTKKQLSELLFPLSPINEQNRIVEKIEELFTKLDAGVAALEKVRAQLKRFRQAVLKAAFSGQLTTEWRQKHSNVGAGSSRPNNSQILNAHGGATTAPLQNGNLPNLPTEWMWGYLGNYADVYGGKRLPKGHFYSDSKTEFKYIRVTDFENLTINQSNIRYLKPETEKLIVKYKISKNDIYISIAGSIGKIGTIPDNLDKANLTENAAKITNLKNFNRKYLSYFLNSNFGQEQIRKLTISSNQPKLALFRIKKIIVPLTIPEEQHQIVSEIERRFSVADEVEKTVENALKQSKRLRQSILKMAFEGRLVPQDPKDEPAEKLLERIRIEKQKLAKKGKK